MNTMMVIYESRTATERGERGEFKMNPPFYFSTPLPLSRISSTKEVGGHVRGDQPGNDNGRRKTVPS